MFSELQQLEGAGRHNETEDDGEVWLQVIKKELEIIFLSYLSLSKPLSTVCCSRLSSLGGGDGRGERQHIVEEDFLGVA